MNVRKAIQSDAASIALLMRELGYAVNPATIATKIAEFSAHDYDEVFVAENDGVLLGCVSCHVTSLLYQPGASGRITSLVVDASARGSGIGQVLVKTAEAFFQDSGCVKVEVTSSKHRHAAHEFYRSCGFSQEKRCFVKSYG